VNIVDMHRRAACDGHGSIGVSQRASTAGIANQRLKTSDGAQNKLARRSAVGRHIIDTSRNNDVIPIIFIFSHRLWDRHDLIVEGEHCEWLLGGARHPREIAAQVSRRCEGRNSGAHWSIHDGIDQQKERTGE
jgi:hypothetical protein